MPKSRPNEELFEDGKKTLRFVADNNFGKAVNEMGRDISLIFNDLASGLVPVQDIENIIVCGIVDIDGDVVIESARQPLADDIISRYGLQQCHQLVFVLLSHIMLGEKKSSEIDVSQRREAMAKILLPGHLTSCTKVGWLWAAIWISSGLLACLITRF